MKKIAIFTGTRAEYGLLYWIIKALHESAEVELQLWVGGSHFSELLGHTVDEIKSDGFDITAQLNFLLENDSPVSVTKSLGQATIQAAECFERYSPDVMVILGDRYEALAIAQAALVAHVPIAHIHGGELTEGVIDDAIRHAITKMSSLHFASTQAYRQRIIQLGEHPNTVYCSGAPGLDSLYRETLMTSCNIKQVLNVSNERHYFLVTYHPDSSSFLSERASQTILLDVLAQYEEFDIVITYPNADSHGRSLIDDLEKFQQKYSHRVHLFKSLGRYRYLCAVKHCSAVIGNSSSGIIEVPSLQVATINIGNRQKGRIAAESVIHSECNAQAIKKAIEQAIDSDFKASLQQIENPYGTGGSSEFIVKKLIESHVKNTQKAFYDLGGAPYE